MVIFRDLFNEVIKRVVNVNQLTLTILFDFVIVFLDYNEVRLL